MNFRRHRVMLTHPRIARTAVSSAPFGQRATDHDVILPRFAGRLVELIEAAARCGMTETAMSAYGQLADIADASGSDWVLGAQARSHALLSEG
jgi:hypothetical protein